MGSFYNLLNGYNVEKYPIVAVAAELDKLLNRTVDDMSITFTSFIRPKDLTSNHQNGGAIDFKLDRENADHSQREVQLIKFMNKISSIIKDSGIGIIVEDQAPINGAGPNKYIFHIEVRKSDMVFNERKYSFRPYKVSNHAYRFLNWRGKKNYDVRIATNSYSEFLIKLGGL